MTHQSVADDQYGQLWRRLNEIAHRVDEGSIPFDATMRSLQLVVEGKPEASVSPTYPVIVNYDLSLAEMITAGRYDWINSDVTREYFPVNGTGIKVVVTELVHFDRVMDSSDDVIRELDRRGLRPATIEELLAFGAKYPEPQRQFPIMALGSVWRRLDGRGVPYLGRDGLGRRMGLGWFEGRWSGLCRFLAVRK